MEKKTNIQQNNWKAKENKKQDKFKKQLDKDSKHRAIRNNLYLEKDRYLQEYAIWQSG